MAEARPQWGRHWPLVLTSCIGVSLGTLSSAATGVFMAPLQAEFGWSRMQMSSGMLVYALMVVPLSPFIGLAIDRWGARRLAIPGSILVGLAFAALGLANGSIVQWWALWSIYGLIGLAVKPTIWTTAVAAAFERGRGMALALTLSGTGITTGVAPLLAAWLIDKEGWRAAYAIIGVGWTAITATLVLLFFVDARSRLSERERAALPGLHLREALRSPPLLILVAVALMAQTINTGLTVHFVPIMTDGGVTRGSAAALAAIFGPAAVAGKLVTGYFFDRWSARVTAAVSQTLPIGACLLLFGPRIDPVLAGCAVALVGYSAGACLTSASYLCARHVGMRAYAASFSVIASAMALAVGMGPPLFGFGYDHDGDYRIVLLISMPVVALCALLLAITSFEPARAPEAAA